MKKLLLAYCIAVAILGFVSNPIFANEPTNNTGSFPKSFKPVEFVPNEAVLSSLKHSGDKPLAIEFKILDSLANAYSYFTESQQPFVYIPELGKLITIKRGYWDIDRYPYFGDNTKNNLFVLTSDDWGKTWSEPFLVYKTEGMFSSLWARYPSVYAFPFEDDIAYVYTAPVTNGSGWIGFVNGVYFQGSYFPNYSYMFNWDDGNRYGWGGTDSRIVGGMGTDGNPFAMAVSSIMIESGLPLDKTSNLGYRRTIDFDKWEITIPPQWQSNVFRTPQSTNDSVRASAISGFKYGLDGKLYMAAYANFANTSLDVFTFGVSVSTDNGKTWSDFDIMPPDLFGSYLSQYGLNDSLATWGLPQFVPISEGNYYFLTNFNEDTNRTFRPWDEAWHQLAEVYKENGTWGIRKIADLTGYAVRYVAPTNINQLGEESQLVRTVDGTKLVAKWVDFTDVQIGDTVYKRAQHDVFVSVRPLDNSSWIRIKNVTNDLDLDRITWLPDQVPNDLRDIPLLKLVSIPIEGQTDQEAILRQRSLDTVPQYLLLGFFNADDILSVDEQTSGSSGSDATVVINSVYPVPAERFGFINLDLSRDTDSKIDLYNVLGENVRNIHDGIIAAGNKGISFRTDDLPNGNYTIVFNFGGKVIAKPFIIMK